MPFAALHTFSLKEYVLLSVHQNIDTKLATSNDLCVVR